MFVKQFAFVELCLLVLCVILQRSESLRDVVYEGRKYVAEGDPFNISCHRSEYGNPKWTKNGVAVEATDPEYFITEQKLPYPRIGMLLTVQAATWRHRGEYKCDSLRSTSHIIEIVPTRETDREMRSQSRVLLRPGKTLELVCEKEEIFAINWYKDGKRILESEDDTRIHMEGKILRIEAANINDVGEYVCIIETSGLSYAISSHQGSLIRVTDTGRVEKFPPQIRPILDRNLSVECKVQGFPTPRIAWFIDDIAISVYRQNESRYSVMDNSEGLPNAVFFIRDVNHGDNHVITCTADNLEGSAETTAELAVRGNQIFTNEDYPGNGIVLHPGQDLVLVCNNTNIQGEDEITWYRNYEPLQNTSGRLRKENCTLVVKEAIESDAGNYTCISSDRSNATIAVRTLVKLVPFDNSRNVVQGQSIVLICNVTQGIPLPELKWFKDNEELNTSDPRISVKADTRGINGTELIIADAQFDDRAEYTCTASNGYSSANATILVRVKDKYAALWPFLGICAEVAVLCTIIFIYEKRRQKPDFDESETEHNTENKNISDQEEKGRDIRQRK